MSQETYRDAAYLGQPVRSLQSMLRAISFTNSAIPRIVPNGVFDEQTLEALMVFQREEGLPVTGKADKTTWETLTEAYEESNFVLSQPRSANLFPDYPYVVIPGTYSPFLIPIQGMFNVLSTILSNLEPVTVNGVHTGASVHNTIWLQERCGEPPNGILDRTVWDRLSRLYDAFVIRNPNTIPNGS